MNIRLILFSGLVTALVGVMVGLALAYISQRELRKNAIVVGGASLGFMLGATSSMMMQQKQERADDYHDLDGLK